MPPLYIKLLTETNAAAREARCTLRALQPQIEQAERLAEKLRGAGVAAYANGTAHGGITLLWVDAEPRSAPALDDALTRIDAREIGRTYLHHHDAARYAIRLEGHDCDLCVRIPQQCAPN